MDFSSGCIIRWSYSVYDSTAHVGLQDIHSLLQGHLIYHATHGQELLPLREVRGERKKGKKRGGGGGGLREKKNSSPNPSLLTGSHFKLVKVGRSCSIKMDYVTLSHLQFVPQGNKILAPFTPPPAGP